MPDETKPPESADCAESKPATTLADLFAGRLGGISSGGHERLSEVTGDEFAAYLETKRRDGRL